VELTKNPDAMISALRKVSGQSKLEAPDELRGMFLDNTADKADFAGLFATHPPIEKRIAALVKFAGGRDQGPWGPTRTSTAVPTT
jgi:heat shock protein HtpX